MTFIKLHAILQCQSDLTSIRCMFRFARSPLDITNYLSLYAAIRPVARLSLQGGTKITRGPHFLNTILDVCRNRQSKHEMRRRKFLMGGRAPLAPQWRRPWRRYRDRTTPFHYMFIAPFVQHVIIMFMAFSANADLRNALNVKADLHLTVTRRGWNWLVVSLLKFSRVAARLSPPAACLRWKRSAAFRLFRDFRDYGLQRFASRMSQWKYHGG